MLDFNRSVMSAKAASVIINERIDAGLMAGAIGPLRGYLGASSIGHECLRRIQWDWIEPGIPDARIARIFARGHWAEDYTAERLTAAGFHLKRTRSADGKPIGFSTADGRFRGHCDGVLLNGPNIDGIAYPALWEHKCLGAASWRKLEREGLRKARPEYYAQIQLYMAYLDLTEAPAIFTAMNADTCELLHLLVPFDAEEAQRVSDRAVAVIRAVEAQELLPRLVDEPGDWRCRACVYRERCWP